MDTERKGNVVTRSRVREDVLYVYDEKRNVDPRGSCRCEIFICA